MDRNAGESNLDKGIKPHSRENSLRGEGENIASREYAVKILDVRINIREARKENISRKKVWAIAVCED